VQQRHPDPFFGQLEADLREGVDAADRGELIPADDVWAQLYARVDDIEKSQPPQ
jgi:predicted transcriptional regulator